MKTVSIIVTTYNSADRIDEVLKSITNQYGLGKDFEIEIIVVDDCSLDNTRDIVKKYDAKLIVNDVNSGGPNRGRNIGLKLAKGDYICIADHDDIWREDKLQIQLPLLEKFPIVTSGYALKNYTTGKIDLRTKPKAEYTIIYKKNETFRQRLIRSNTGQNAYLGGIIFHRSLASIQFEEHFGVVDYDWLVMLFRNNTSAEINDDLYIRNVHGANLSLDANYRRKDFFYSLYFTDTLRHEFPLECKTAYKRLHGSRARYFYVIGDLEQARSYFLKAGLSWKHILYYLTTFAGRKFVLNRFNVFG